jgi:hypothetical protein
MTCRCRTAVAGICSTWFACAFGAVATICEYHAKEAKLEEVVGLHASYRNRRPARSLRRLLKAVEAAEASGVARLGAPGRAGYGPPPRSDDG